jgi:C4-dicarboxylate transporter/malic acid transport protein
MTRALDQDPLVFPWAVLPSARQAIRCFTPNAFAATMGTGILALTLGQLPGAGPTVHAVAEALWLADIGLFALFTVLYAARWTMFFHEARRIFDDPVASMYFGCIPMGLATLINGLLLFGRYHWGDAAVDGAWALWRLDVILSLACGLAIPFAMVTRQHHALEGMTAIWLLPVVAAEVAAVTGGLLAPLLRDRGDQLAALVAGYALWGYSVPLAFGILTILLLRMALHGLPPARMAASSWLALGPIGTGALGLLVLGWAAPALLAHAGLGDLGPAIRAMGLAGALVLWGCGLWWMGLAALVTLRQLRQGLPFNLGWWGYTFPLGVYAAATLRLAAILPLPALTTLAQAMVLALATIWLVVAARTLAGAWRGDLFDAPALTD